MAFSKLASCLILEPSSLLETSIIKLPHTLTGLTHQCIYSVAFSSRDDCGSARLSERAVVSQAAQRRELHKPSGSASSLSSVENFRQPGAAVGGPLQQSLLGTSVNQQHSSEFDIQQRRRIVELALRKLDTGSDGEPSKAVSPWIPR